MKLKNRRISVLNTIILVFLMVATSMPLYVMLVGTFKPNIALISNPVDLNPFKNLSFVNFIKALTDSDIFLWMRNSLIISLSVALLTAVIGVMAGYPFARMKFRGKNLLFTLVMATMMMPKQVLLIPNFLVANKLGLVNTIIGVILTTLAPAYSVFLAKQSISSLPSELFDAAEVDGCSEPGKFFRIALPLSLPSMGTAAIFAFFSTFNDYVWQLIMITEPKLRTLPIGVSTLASLYVNNKGIQLAGSLIASIPLIIIFLLAQKVFIKGSTDGALKG